MQTLTPLHGELLAQAFGNIIGRAEPGTVAYVRCLPPDVIEGLARSPSFKIPGWQVERVANDLDEEARTITADVAVELRESKGAPLLLLVDTVRAGAGMDGIYSAAREIKEGELFPEALKLAKGKLERSHRDYAERSLKKAGGRRRKQLLSPWSQFDFLVRAAAEKRHPGELVYLIGLWPIEHRSDREADKELAVSRLFVDRLLERQAAGMNPVQRIESLHLLGPSPEQITALRRFLTDAAANPLLPALAELANRREIWVGPLWWEEAEAQIQSIELVPWRTGRNNRIAKWSGLELSDPEDLPRLILDPDAEEQGKKSSWLEVRWKARPQNLAKGAVQYSVQVMTDKGEEITSETVIHRGREPEKCRFTIDDFSYLKEEAVITAKVVISVLGNDRISEQETEEFNISFGTRPPEAQGKGRPVRSFSEGLIELSDREAVSQIASEPRLEGPGKGGQVVLRTGDPKKTFRVFAPLLLRDIGRAWSERKGEVGRWSLRVRESGERVGGPEFIPLDISGSVTQDEWERVRNLSGKLADRFDRCGGVDHIYDEKSKSFDVVRDYVLAWATVLEKGDPTLALANTVEVKSLSGRTIGLIVLPSHPIRVAWYAAYDNLVFYARFDENVSHTHIRKEFKGLDGAMFPAFLPGIGESGTFVFADTLGFHAVGMVSDKDTEPKATVAILARALGEGDSQESAPSVGKQSAEVLGREIQKYLDCHDRTGLLRIHALRPGDGFTVARALGIVNKAYETESEDDEGHEAPSFMLELYPSNQQRALSGRYLIELTGRRRKGVGGISESDLWMFKSQEWPGGIPRPRLRWARREVSEPQTPAHLSVAFDTFESRVTLTDPDSLREKSPFHVFGLLSFYEREFTVSPMPHWCHRPLIPTEGDKHPSDRPHTDRLMRLQQGILRCVSRSLGEEGKTPVLETAVTPEKADTLRRLHRLSDWVITLDRNAGIEYFDSPRDNKEIYDHYVIDCVPEREDLGCLQLITSTSNLEEVRCLLDDALDQMGLSQSRRNAEFLMNHLKALSGRLAIRLTGKKGPTSELIALALAHAHALEATKDERCWTPLSHGFFVPIDDVRDLLPPTGEEEKNENQGATDLRPDLIYVSLGARKGLSFRFIEVKYRRHLRSARDPELLTKIGEQIRSLRDRWNDWYKGEGVGRSLQAIRQAKLARVLRFYADKAHRHYDDQAQVGLSDEVYRKLLKEIDRMVSVGQESPPVLTDTDHRGWIFCPEYRGSEPLEISIGDSDIRVFMFGPERLPDLRAGEHSGGKPASQPAQIATPQPAESTSPQKSGGGEITLTVSTPGAETGGALSPSKARGVPVDAVIQESGPSAAEPAICLGQNQITGDPISWKLTVRGNPHLLIAGLSGMGKTTCLLNICHQAAENGVCPIIFSYHEDIDQRLTRIVPKVRFIDFEGLGFNPLEIVERTSPMAYLDVAGALRDIFVAIFPELGDIQGERIREAIKQSFIELGWGDSHDNYELLREPPFGRFLEILQATPKPDQGMRTLLLRLNELADYGFFSPATTYGTLWEDAGPIVIRVHKTQNDRLQIAFASLVFYKLYKDMFRRNVQSRITHLVVFDEAHRAAKLKLIPTMSKECRKYGIALVLASQEARDFHASVFSNIANYLALRLNEVDAKTLVRNVVSSDQERLLIDKIKQLSKFTAYFFELGKRPSLVSLKNVP